MCVRDQGVAPYTPHHLGEEFFGMTRRRFDTGRFFFGVAHWTRWQQGYPRNLEKPVIFREPLGRGGVPPIWAVGVTRLETPPLRASYCRRKALEALQSANGAASDELRSSFLDLAASWRELAQYLEKLVRNEPSTG